MKKDIYSRLLYSSVVFLTLFTIFSCKKEKEESAIEESAYLVFNVGEMNSFAPSTGKHKASYANTQATNNTEASLLKLNKKVSLAYSSKAAPIETRMETGNYSSPRMKAKAASTTPVRGGIKYRILLYDATTNELIKNVEATVGITESIPVQVGTSYKWYAYSYNGQENIPPPTIVNSQPIIATLPDKELIWASSGETPITAAAVPLPLTINFEHKVAEFILEIDTKNLFGKITGINATFVEDYFHTGTLNIQSGVVTTESTPYTSPIISEIDFEPLSQFDSTVFRAKIYTSNEQRIGNIKVKINSLSIKFDNGITQDLLTAANPAKEVEFIFTNPSIAKSHVASIDLRYNIPTKTILHVTGTNHDDDRKWAFAAQPYERDLTAPWSAQPEANRAPFNMIKEPRNFGNLPSSLVHTTGFNHLRCLNDGSLDTKLALEPDIVIMAIYYSLDPDDILALVNYLEKGGVLILMTDGGVPAEVVLIETFFRTLFDKNDITLTHAKYPGSSIFLLDDGYTINDIILNGPFGDIRNKYWGVDTHNTVLAANLPIGEGANEVTLYSGRQAANSATPAEGTEAPMFKHNSLNFFWIGDGSFLSTPQNTSLGWSLGTNAEPFATVNIETQNNPNSLFNYNYYPMPKPKYGYAGNGFATGDNPVYNAPLFANLMAWALRQSEFYGIKTAN